MSTVVRFSATLVLALSLMLQGYPLHAERDARPARDTLAVDWYTIDGGGAMWFSEGILELSATIGQSDTGEVMSMTGGTLSLAGGFWPGVSGGSSLAGDCDGDQSVELDDFTVFRACMNGPEVDMEAGCECADMDSDIDVDLADFAAFQLAFAGS